MTARPGTSTARRPRHTYSPRIRRAAADHALDLATLDRLTGTGRNGRLTVHDVVRAAERRVADVDHSGSTGQVAASFATALVEVDVTRLPTDHLLPVAVTSLCDAVSVEVPSWVASGVFVHHAGEWRLLADAADLTTDGVLRRLAGEGSGEGLAWSPGPRLAVVDVATRGILLDIAPPPEGVRVALGIGAPAERPTVVHDADGAPSIAVRSIAYLTLTYDPAAVTPETAGRLLTGVARRLVA